MPNFESRPLTQKDAARRNAERYFATGAAKQQASKPRDAGDANTLRLRALRLAKEETDRQALALVHSN
jgi:hypothetical protein